MRSLALSTVGLACLLALPSVAAAQGVDFTWTEITPPFTRTANIHFGSQIAWDGERLLIRSEGRLDVFTFDGISAPVFEAMLMPTGDSAGFGGSIAIDHGRILTSANDAADGQHLYEFTLAGTTWSQAARIANPAPTPGDGTFVGIAIDGPRFLVSSPYIGGNRGSVDIVHPPATGPFTWTTANRDFVLGPNPNELTGHVVALHGNEAFVGVIEAFIGGTQAGRVILYRDDGTALTPIRTIDNPSPAYFDQFGDDLDFDSNYLYVGSHYDDTMGTDTGALYVYDRAGTLLQTLYGSVTNGAYGGSIELGGGAWVAVTAQGTSSTSTMGHLHLLQRDAAGMLHERADVPDFTGMPGMHFGEGMAVGGRTIVISSLGAPVGGTSGAGRTWWGTFTVQDGGVCSGDAECTHGHCISGICCNTACSGACDVCGTGTCQVMTCDAGVAPVDAGTDAGSDAGNDAAMSLMPDAGVDAGVDAAADDAAMPGTDADMPGTDGGASVDAGSLADSGRDAGHTTDGSMADATTNADAGGVPRIPLSCTCRAGARSSDRLPLFGVLVGASVVAASRRRRR